VISNFVITYDFYKHILLQEQGKSELTTNIQRHLTNVP